MAGNRGGITYRDLKKSSLGAYLREISRIPLLTREQEQELGTIISRHRDLEARLARLQARAGSKSAAERAAAKLEALGPEYQRAIQKMVESNLRFVVSIANRFSGGDISLLDLINEGNIGLIEAARRYDPTRGVKFISYAVWWIRQAIMQMLAEQGGSVRLPLKQAGLLYKIRAKYEELSKKHSREPTSTELAKALDVTLREVEEVLRVSRRSLSLESPIGEDSDTAYLDLMPEEDARPVDQQLIMNSLAGEIERLLGNLAPREREVIELRFGIGSDSPLTLEEVGSRLGLSRERIRQIEKKAKKRLQRLARGRRLMDFLD